MTPTDAVAEDDIEQDNGSDNDENAFEDLINTCLGYTNSQLEDIIMRFTSESASSPSTQTTAATSKLTMVSVTTQTAADDLCLCQFCGTFVSAC